MGTLDGVEPGEFLGKVRVAPREERILLAAADPAPRRFPVLGVQRVEHRHPFDDAAERREALRVQGLRVVGEIEEELRGAAVGHRERVRDRAALVGHAARVVGDGGRSPGGRDLGNGVDAELGPSTGDHAEEPRLVVVAVADEIVEAVRAAGRPVAARLDDDGALARLETHEEAARGAPIQLGRLRVQEQRRGRE